MYGSQGSPDEDALEANVCDQLPLVADPESSVETVDRGSVEEMASVCTLVTPNFNSRARLHSIPTSRLVFVVYLLLALAAFGVLICVDLRSLWAIFAPVTVAVVLFAAFVYRNYREGRLGWADSLLARFDGCCEADQDS